MFWHFPTTDSSLGTTPWASADEATRFYLERLKQDGQFHDLVAKF
jgi:hypothetical protein